MMTLMIAAAVAAQAAPPADTHGQMAPMQHEKKECCKDGCECCKDKAGKHEGHGAEHDGHGTEHDGHSTK